MTLDDEQAKELMTHILETTGKKEVILIVADGNDVGIFGFTGCVGCLLDLSMQMIITSGKHRHTCGFNPVSLFMNPDNETKH